MKNYEDILGKFPHRGCLDFTINSKLRQLSKEIPEGLCGIYMYVLFDILPHLKEWDSVVIGNSSLSESYVPSSQSRCPDS